MKASVRLVEVRMDYNVLLDAGAGKVSKKGPGSQLTADYHNKSNLTNLRRGQRITGTVLMVDDRITIDFGGQKVSTSKEVLPGAVPGEKKTFEVMKADSAAVELRLIDEKCRELRQVIRAVVIMEKDWEKVLEKKQQEAKQSGKENSARESLDKLKEIGRIFTDADSVRLEQEGFPVETLTVDGLYEAIDRIKWEAAGRQEPAPEKTGMESSQVRMPNSQKNGAWQAVNVQNRERQIDRRQGEGLEEADIAARLREENLPDTAENMERIQKALTLGDTASRMDDKAMRYLIASEMDPTIENIYKACYSGGAGSRRQELTGYEWKQLEGQVKTVIKDAGYEVNQENLSEARWLIENSLPLLPRTLASKKTLNDIREQADRGMVLDRIVEGMKDGTEPKDVSLAVPDPSALQRIVDNVGTISRDAVAIAVHEKQELTIRRLTAIQSDLSAGRIGKETLAEVEAAKAKTVEAERLPSEQEEQISFGRTEEERVEEPKNPAEENSGSDPDAGERSASLRQEYEELKAQRQLEELRLRMTLEAAGRLERKGISIETERLEKVVEELRRLEDSYYQKLLREADAENTQEAAEILKNTVQSMERLRYIPSAVLSSTLAERENQTIPGLLSEGARLQAIFEKAGSAYETLMTVPNPEYGDSIHKAFSRVDSLLSELNIDDTRANQRAARILGYNRMEITQEAIDQVKAYDMEVNALIRNLHPAVTVRMIKEGMNPLQMPIGELNNAIEQMKEEQGITSEDKFSTYLHRLEKENGITPQERKAYIGVYRLLYNIDKSDGAALGAVVKADQEVTLGNLLTAVRTGRRGRVEAAINDDFGMLTELTRQEESISQLLEGIGTAGRQEPDTQKEKVETREQEQYLNRVLKQVTEEISPERLLKLQQEAQLQGSGQPLPEGWAQPPLSEQGGLWETLRDIPLEKLLEQLQDTAEDNTGAGELHAQKAEQLRELSRNAEQSLRFLNDYRMESTPQNIMMANQLLSNGLPPITKQLKKQNENNEKENSDENLEQGLKETEELSDTLIDKSSINEAFENLEAQAKTMLERACSGEVINGSRLAELRMLGQQATFLRRLASREFYRIPIETAKGITNMNLTVIRGSENAGRVSATVWSEELGDINAEFSLKERTWKGFIACNSRDGMEKLKANTAELMQAAEESGVSLGQLDFGLRSWEREDYSYQNPESGEQRTLPGNETERILYRLARAFVRTVGLAENS